MATDKEKSKKILDFTDVLDKDTSAKIQALKDIRNVDSFKYNSLKKGMRDSILETISEGTIGPGDFSKIKTQAKEIPDEQLWNIYNKFTQMTPEERSKYRLDSGAFKDAYQLPDSDLVLKTAISGSDPNLNILEKDYLSHKITQSMGKTQDIETPMLLKAPDREAVLMQRRLVTPTDILKFKNAAGDVGMSKLNPEFVEKAYFGGGLQNEIDNLLKKYPENFIPEDVHAGNVGVDPVTGKMKIFDTLGSYNSMPVTQKHTSRFSNILQNLKSPKIYRSIPLIGPAIGAGFAVMSGEANAASAMPILGEADFLGPEKGSEDYEIENPQRNPAARRAALESMLKK